MVLHAHSCMIWIDYRTPYSFGIHSKAHGSCRFWWQWEVYVHEKNKDIHAYEFNDTRSYQFRVWLTSPVEGRHAHLISSFCTQTANKIHRFSRLQPPAYRLMTDTYHSALVRTSHNPVLVALSPRMPNSLCWSTWHIPHAWRLRLLSIRSAQLRNHINMHTSTGTIVNSFGSGQSNEYANCREVGLSGCADSCGTVYANVYTFWSTKLDRLRFNAHPRYSSRHDPCTNAMTPLYKSSSRNTHWQTGTRLPQRGCAWDLKSGTIINYVRSQ
jgi:hypothetical protein